MSLGREAAMAAHRYGVRSLLRRRPLPLTRVLSSVAPMSFKDCAMDTHVLISCVDIITPSTSIRVSTQTLNRRARSVATCTCLAMSLG